MSEQARAELVGQITGALEADYEQQIEDLTQRLNDACVDLVETRSSLAGRRKMYEALIGQHAGLIGQASRYRYAWLSARRRAGTVTARAGYLSDAAEEALQQLRQMQAERDEARAEVVRLGRENEQLVNALREANGGRAVMIARHRALISVVRDREAAAMAQGAPEFAAATDRLRAALAEERIEGETG